MRICGEKEKLITGDADDFDRFVSWSRTLPQLAGNPLYFWSMMELERVFGITEPLNEKTARAIYEQANEMLSQEGFTAKGLLKRFHVEYAAPCVGLTDDLSVQMLHRLLLQIWQIGAPLLPSEHDHLPEHRPRLRGAP